MIANTVTALRLAGPGSNAAMSFQGRRRARCADPSPSSIRKPERDMHVALLVLRKTAAASLYAADTGDGEELRVQYNRSYDYRYRLDSLLGLQGTLVS